MQFIGLILNQVLIPVATVFFILSGLVAAITSAGIEYSVFNSLFTSTNQTRIPTWLIASSFVVVLEYSKIYLHYLNGRIPYLSDTFSKQFIKQAKAGKDITLYGGGNIKRTFTHIEDLCYQIVLASMKDESNGEIYNVGGQTLSLREAAEIIARKYGTNVMAVEWSERDLRIESEHTYFDDTKIRTLLNCKDFKQLEDFSRDI